MKKLEEKIKQKQSTQDKFFTIFTLIFSAFGIVYYENSKAPSNSNDLILVILLVLLIVLLVLILYLYNEISDLINKL